LNSFNLIQKKVGVKQYQKKEKRKKKKREKLKKRE